MNKIHSPNKKYIYTFKLEAKTSLYIGEREQGEVLRDANGQPFVSANSIGGALREYLVKSGKTEQEIIGFMGGERLLPTDGSKQLKEFIESKLYISDGLITDADAEKGSEITLEKKEGTRINSRYGSAFDNHKYSLSYIPAGCIVSFKIECDIMPDVNEEDESADLEKLIKLWTRAFESGDIRLGGKKSNDFGKFKVMSLQCKTYVFDSIAAVDDFIFNRHVEEKADAEGEEITDWKHADPSQPMRPKLIFVLKGQFPFGVYQSFRIQNDGNKEGSNVTLTGLQKIEKGTTRYIPASSMKGLIRQQFELLVQRMLAHKHFSAQDNKEDLIAALCAELFGSNDCIGQLIISDMILQADSPVQVERIVKNENKKQSEVGECKLSKANPVYIKIDRLTGSVLGSALKHQYEVAGEASWELQLCGTRNLEQSPFIFPLLYILRRIGLGEIPVGGRSVIGLGQFSADKLEVKGLVEGTLSLSDMHCKYLSESNENQLRQFYNYFVSWLEDAEKSWQDRRQLNGTTSF